MLSTKPTNADWHAWSDALFTIGMSSTTAAVPFGDPYSADVVPA